MTPVRAQPRANSFFHGICTGPSFCLVRRRARAYFDVGGRNQATLTDAPAAWRAWQHCPSQRALSHRCSSIRRFGVSSLLVSRPWFCPVLSGSLRSKHPTLLERPPASILRPSTWASPERPSLGVCLSPAGHPGDTVGIGISGGYRAAHCWMAGAETPTCTPAGLTMATASVDTRTQNQHGNHLIFYDFIDFRCRCWFSL